jgi:hypothetical protein
MQGSSSAARARKPCIVIAAKSCFTPKEQGV